MPSNDEVGHCDVIVAVGCSLARNGSASPQSAAIAETAKWLAITGMAPRLLLQGKGHRRPIPQTEADAMRTVIGTRVPEEAILYERDSYNTRFNALCFKKIAKHRGWKSALVVAWRPHAGRVEAAYRKVLGPNFQLQVVRVDAPAGGSSKWFMNHYLSFLIWNAASFAYFWLRGWV